MQAARIRPDAHFYNMIIRACRDCGVGPVGNRVIQEMEAEQERAIRQRLTEQQKRQKLLPASAFEMSTGRRTTDEPRKVPTLEELNEMLGDLEQEEADEGKSSEVAEVETKGKEAAVFLPYTNFK